MPAFLFALAQTVIRARDAIAIRATRLLDLLSPAKGLYPN